MAGPEFTGTAAPGEAGVLVVAATVGDVEEDVETLGLQAPRARAANTTRTRPRARVMSTKEASSDVRMGLNLRQLRLSVKTQKCQAYPRT
jgi:hypothetical protein